MARNMGDKLKLLYIKDYLQELSDEDHPLSATEIIDRLADDYSLQAERKSIYRDMGILGYGGASDEDEDNDDELRQSYGLDIRMKNKSYYLASRDFSMQEVKLLVDMVESSSNIPYDTAKELIGKLQKLVSINNRKHLQRHIDIRNQVKSLNEQFQNNADLVFEAINGNKNIKFQYFSYGTDKKKILRRGGKVYEISPFALVWVDQNYYMIGYMAEKQEMRTFRVDRMTKTKIGKASRTGSIEYEKLTGGNLSAFINKVFHMYLGPLKMVTMRFDNNLVDTVIDRFGEDIMLHPCDSKHFTITTEVATSPQFYGWLAGFGPLAELVAPQDEREKMKNHLRQALNVY